MSAKRALVAAPLLPEYDRESGGQRLYDLVMFLRDAGWAVSFVAQNMKAKGSERYARALRQRGVATYGGFGQRTEELIAEGGFDLAIFAFWYVAERLLPTVRLVSPSTRIAVDTIDLHFLRNARRLFGAAAGDPVSQATLDVDYAAELARELNAYAAADAVLTVSRKEAQLVEDFVGEPGLAHAVTDTEEFCSGSARLDRRKGILFVGNYRHPPNVEAVEYLCKRVLPLLEPELRREHPVYSVGNDLSAKVAGFAAELDNVHMVGWVPSLVPYLQRSRVTVVPLLYGAGTKRKVLQALAAGTPTVATSIGAEGLTVDDGVHMLIADDAAEFARAIARVLEDDKLWRRLARNGRAYVGGGYTRIDVSKQFGQMLDAVLEKTPKRLQHGPQERQLHARLVKPRYREIVRRTRKRVLEVVPERATVAVVSRGDPELLELDGRQAFHFPFGADGGWLGYHPANGPEALEHLRAARAKGATYLVIPEPSRWWLDSYPEFATRLRRAHELVLDDNETCLIFKLK